MACTAKELEYGARYREKHGERARAATQKWRAAHPEHEVPYEARKAYMRARYLKNRERILAAQRIYKKLHPWVNRAACARSYARKMGAQGTFTVEQFVARSSMYGDKCWIPACGLPGEEIDHVIPLSRGGANWPANLRPICAHHNMRKHAKPWKVFLSEIAGAAL